METNQLNPETRIHNLTLDQIQAETQRFMVKVYGWMCMALFITGFMAMYTASSEALLGIIFGNRFVFFGLNNAELIAVGSLAGLVHRISATTATLIFIGYSILNGLTLSVIFFVFTTESIASTFFITGGTFGVMSFYGYTTKSDLSKWGNLLFMGLMGIVIASIANFFMKSETLYWVTTYIGVIVFVGLTAYDTQKIKNTNIIGNEGTEEDSKEAIMGALALYLDFINLFLFLLRIFGRRR
jgi:FtsH-binding integral membrane protein